MEESPNAPINKQETGGSKTYKIERRGDVLKLSFGSPAQNDQIVRDAVERLHEMEASGDFEDGNVIKLNGPASLPVAMAIAQSLSEHFQVVAAFDPKMNKYVVAITKDPNYKIGDLID